MASDLLDRGAAVAEILVVPDLPVLPDTDSPRRWHRREERGGCKVGVFPYRERHVDVPMRRPLGADTVGDTNTVDRR